MVVWPQRAAGLRDQIGAQRHRLGQRDVVAQPRADGHLDTEFLVQFTRQPVGVALPRRDLPARQLPQTGQLGRPFALATSRAEPAMSAPATTIWFGIAADGIPSKGEMAWLCYRTNKWTPHCPTSTAGSTPTARCTGRSSSPPSSTASTPYAGSANGPSRRITIPTSISVGGQ